ncbi:MAG: phytoene desaturase [Balneolaceae bacterium]|nr:phytoene desaturase [Balneolaceae bacterium]
MEKRKKIIVIGSGFGGLSSAIRLAAKGHDVNIIEKRDKPGGRAYQYDINGFKFDGGPTVITAPYIFDEIFDAAGKKRDDYFTLAPLDPFYRIFDSDGRHFDYMRNEEDVLRQIDLWNPADKAGYLKFTRRTTDIFSLFHPYTDKPFLQFKNMLKIMPGVIRLGAYMGTHQYVRRYIKHDFLRKVFSFHPLLIGGNPFDTPSIYLLIMQFEKEWGVHYAVGGVSSIVKGFSRLFEELGGTMLLNSEVDQIMVLGENVTGVRLKDGTVHEADIVVSNADSAFTYRNLIPEESRKKYKNRQIDRKSYSSSLFVIYFGTKKRYLDSKLSHHNIILSREYKRLMKQIFKGTKLPDDLSLYLHMPTRSDSSIAPEGSELFYVLALVPNMKADIEWEQIAEEYKNRILDFLEKNYLPDLRENIIAEHYIDPPHFKNTLNSHYGAAFSFTPSLLQSAFFRPHNRSEQFRNLYFAGAGTHPGAGVPAVLSSGKIVAELIDPTPNQNGI